MLDLGELQVQVELDKHGVAHHQCERGQQRFVPLRILALATANAAVRQRQRQICIWIEQIFQCAPPKHALDGIRRVPHRPPVGVIRVPEERLHRTKGRIRRKPKGVFLHKVVKFLVAVAPFPVQAQQLPADVALCLHDSLVVHSRAIQSSPVPLNLAQNAYMRRCIVMHLDWVMREHLRQANVHGVEGEYGERAVRVRVHPVVVHAGVVHGQQLNDGHVRH
mmetsp:Transcript_33272/g.71758  ORF Transcript_33272/g.71758 Transcript_33272/m.71758 type:complete len:221 (-) Transcript_33272:237-899(-)